MKNFENKIELHSLAEKSTEYNEKGQAVISAEAPWFNEDIWEKIFEYLDTMSDEEFLAFVKECEETPDILLDVPVTCQ